MSPAVLAHVTALYESIMHDEHRSGGMLSKHTIRLVNELVVLIATETRAAV